MTTTPILLRDDRDGIARLTMNRPANHNALSDAMIAALSAALSDIAADASVRVVILAGLGKAFCAGHDLREMQAHRQDPDQGRAFFTGLFARCAAMMAQIRALPQPVIAQVHGIATAAGCQLVATCDLAVAADTARFGVNGIDIGLFCSTPMVALSRNIPRKQAFEMLTTGSFIPAARAEALGLINRATPAATLAEETDALARTLAAKLAPALHLGKRAFYAQLEMPVAEADAHASEAIVENLLWRDTDEGISAFLEKRRPAWQG